LRESGSSGLIAAVEVEETGIELAPEVFPPVLDADSNPLILNKDGQFAHWITDGIDSQSNCQSVCLQFFDFPNFFRSRFCPCVYITVVPMNILILLPATGGCIDTVTEIILPLCVKI